MTSRTSRQKVRRNVSISGAMSDAESWLSFGYLAWMVIGTVFVAVLINVAVSLISTVCFCVKMEKKLRDIPGPPGHWLLGNLEQFESIDTQLDKMLEYQRKYGSVVKMKFGPWYYVVEVSDPEGMQAILTTAEPKHPLVYGFLSPYLVENLLTGSGARWARMRRLLTPAFHFDILQSYAPVFADSVKTMVGNVKQLIEQDPRINIQEYIHMLTLDNILKCTLGYQGNDIQTLGKEHCYLGWVKEFKTIFLERYNNPLVYNDFIFLYLTSQGRRFREIADSMHNFSMSVIKERRKHKENNKRPEGKKYLDFVDILLEAKDEDGTGLTDEEIRAEVDAFVFAGHDTVAITQTWFLYNMATHPEYQIRCYEEIMEILGDREEFNWDDAGRMVYMTKCLKESMRMFPPVPILDRLLTKPLQLPNGYVAPEGTWISTPHWSLHRNPDVWKNPEMYDPERFSDENNKKRHPFAFVPFSAGPRNCIGQRFAWTELKITLATLLKNFEFSFKEPEKPVPIPISTLEPKDGMWLTLKLRS